MPVGMSLEENRRQLHAWVSSDALDSWQRFARVHHTNVTALLEALGRQLATADELPAHRLPAILRQAVKDAQEIAGSRSTRTRR